MQRSADVTAPPAAPPASASLPPDPARFVADAERATNERDVDGAVSVYADGAVLETLTNGVSERHSGLDAIRAAWGVYFAVLADAELVLRKRLLAVGDGIVVNEWLGELRGHRAARGVESWRFDASGRVTEHQLYNYLDVRPSTSPAARVRLLVAHPRLALSFLRNQRRGGRRSGA